MNLSFNSIDITSRYTILLITITITGSLLLLAFSIFYVRPK